MIDETNLQHINQVDGAFLVDSVLHLRAEDGKITYTVSNVPEYWKRYGTDAVDYTTYIRNPDKAAFLAYVDKQTAGQIILRRNWNRYCYIEDIAVDQKFRQHGIGRRLIAAAIEWAKAGNLPGIMLETQNNNVAACRFYESCGFHLGGLDNDLYRGVDPATSEMALYWYLIF